MMNSVLWDGFCALQSWFHYAVSNCLDRIGIPNEFEWKTPDKLFSVDLMLNFIPRHDINDVSSSVGTQARRHAPTGGSLVVVEVDGPSHFTANTRSTLGSTSLRRRLLAVRGLDVVSIPWYEWEPIKRSPAMQDLYLREKLDGHIQGPPRDQVVACPNANEPTYPHDRLLSSARNVCRDIEETQSRNQTQEEVASSSKDHESAILTTLHGILNLVASIGSLYKVPLLLSACEVRKQ
mmetsp:Transcript_20591/g.39142  ORF Transcript_20591/g.39142 Transcript_20591/m.39142 type:complete len:236 (-) Transcript_20591:134-841(-)